MADIYWAVNNTAMQENKRTILSVTQDASWARHPLTIQQLC